MALSKEDFCKYIQAISDLQDKCQNMMQGIVEIFDATNCHTPFAEFHYPFIATIKELIALHFSCDKSAVIEDIDYYFFEVKPWWNKEGGSITIGNTKYKIQSPEDLYNYLLARYGK